MFSDGNGAVVEREEDFNPNHWQTESSIEDIRSIEKGCHSPMKLLNYPIFRKGAANG